VTPRVAIAGLLLAMLAPAAARAQVEPPADSTAVAPVAAPSDSNAVETVESPQLAAAGKREPKAPQKLEALVPDVAAHPWRIEPGPRPYRQRLSFSPTAGVFGDNRFFAARFTFNPQEWLGYEWSVGHTPGQSTHAALHTISAIVRKPFAGRFQPYLSGGYGMVMVFPGPSVNASPVTNKELIGGVGLEFYIRGDLALRADWRGASVFGRERDRDGVVTYTYGQQMAGLAFYRTLKP
jgi:hypothetical protein